jgi:hypothetical protein
MDFSWGGGKMWFRGGGAQGGTGGANAPPACMLKKALALIKLWQVAIVTVILDMIIICAETIVIYTFCFYITKKFFYLRENRLCRNNRHLHVLFFTSPKSFFLTGESSVQKQLSSTRSVFTSPKSFFLTGEKPVLLGNVFLLSFVRS